MQPSCRWSGASYVDHHAPDRPQTTRIVAQEQRKASGATGWAARDMTAVSAPERVKALVKRTATEVRRRFGVETRIIWYGSWVEGTARPNSDIDLGVLTPSLVPHSDWTALWSWVDDLHTLYSVDLVNLHSVGERLRNEVLNQGTDV